MIVIGVILAAALHPLIADNSSVRMLLAELIQVYHSGMSNLIDKLIR